MGKINSKQKGSRGERLWRDFCREHGFEDVRRTRQYSGNPEVVGSSDCVGIKGLHQEVKFVEKLNIDNAITQAITDAGQDEIPIVAHKKKYKDWKVTLLAEDFLRIYKEYLNYKEKDIS